ncbi:hypothetical protein DB346_14040 [Verrucomicrobia bacterium LW23]|nr:hypothetical protein DB346_14040 [Verrucomicrobia bacterium LW23]
MKSLLLLLLCTLAQAAPQPLFQGVTLEKEVRTVPRPLELYWIEADLSAPGVSLEFTPAPSPGGPMPMPTPSTPAPPATTPNATKSPATASASPAAKAAGASRAEMLALKPTDLIAKLGWQVILNGDAFAVPGAPKRLPSLGEPIDVNGSAVHHGRTWSGAARNPAAAPKYGIFYQLRNGTCGVSYKAVPGAWNAIGGFRILLKDGKITAPDATPLHPRSVVAVNNRKRRIWFLLVDGRRQGQSEGATEREVAEWLLARGATDALNLDGGGSSILATNTGPAGRPSVKVINQPVGLLNIPGTERPVANCLGIKALPLK